MQEESVCVCVCGPVRCCLILDINRSHQSHGCPSLSGSPPAGRTSTPLKHAFDQTHTYTRYDYGCCKLHVYFQLLMAFRTSWFQFIGIIEVMRNTLIASGTKKLSWRRKKKLFTAAFIHLPNTFIKHILKVRRNPIQSWRWVLRSLAQGVEQRRYAPDATPSS